MPDSILARDTSHLDALVTQAIQKEGPRCDLNHIDVSCVFSFAQLFQNTAFDGDISKWNVGNARTMVDMFHGCPFNGDISGWDVSQLRDASAMFYRSKFCGDVSHWNPINLQEADGMFASTPFNGDVSQWHLPFLSSAMRMFDTPSFHGDLSQWTLAADCLYGQMVHAEFGGQLPKVLKMDSSDAYASMFGNADILARYAKRTPFGRMHAQLLLEANGGCEWASRKVVRWARDVGEMGRAMGMDKDDIVQLLVTSYGERPQAAPRIDSQLFEEPPNEAGP